MVAVGGSGRSYSGHSGHHHRFLEHHLTTSSPPTAATYLPNLPRSRPPAARGPSTPRNLPPKTLPSCAKTKTFTDDPCAFRPGGGADLHLSSARQHYLGKYTTGPSLPLAHPSLLFFITPLRCLVRVVHRWLRSGLESFVPKETPARRSASSVPRPSLPSPPQVEASPWTLSSPETLVVGHLPRRPHPFLLSLSAVRHRLLDTA